MTNQVGSHGNQMLSEASASAQSEAQKDSRTSEGRQA
jgi:hypothetical protein